MPLSWTDMPVQRAFVRRKCYQEFPWFVAERYERSLLSIKQMNCMEVWYDVDTKY